MINRNSNNFDKNSELIVSPCWKQQIRESITKTSELCKLLNLKKQDLPQALFQKQDFVLKVPRCFVNRMKKNDPHDPLLNQVLPVTNELIEDQNFILDPLNELQKNNLSGVIHKYQGRVLLILSGGCAINCRFCFRRHFPYNENKLTGLHLEKVIKYIKEDNSLEEIILSGGDPLATSDQHIHHVISELGKIAHVKRIRFHTRMPIVLPSRITQEFIQSIKHPKLQTIIVIHCNHPNEIDFSVENAIKQLHQNNIMILNQSVLLKSINDDSETLIGLSHKLIKNNVFPYYLHILDKVQGATHFDVPLSKAKQIIKTMLANTSGYLVPKLVQENYGEPNKTIIPI